jgi:hypothetical protein
MRGDQLARPWWVIRAIEDSTEGLTVAENARSDGTQRTARERSHSKAYSNNWNGLFCYEGPKPIARLILSNGRA